MITLPIQAAAEVWVERVLNSLPAGFVIALFAWMVLRVLRRQNSGTRFAVWFVALLTIAGMPLGLPLMTGFRGGSSWLAAGSPFPAAKEIVRAPITLPEHWALFIFLAWAVVSFVTIARLMVGLWRLRALRKSCAAIDASSFDPAVRKTVDDFSASRAVTIATSEVVRVPAAIGFWKPMIVIPGWALRKLSPEELNIILLHEHAHLQRWDDWTNLVQKTVRALFFFHPAMWWIENRLSVEREMACDDAVLAETANPRGYARCLISLLEKSPAHRGWAMAQAVVHRAHEASLRLAQILDTDRPAATRVWKPALGLVSGFAIACLALSPDAPRVVAFRQSARQSATSATRSVDANATTNVNDASPWTAGRSVQLESAAVVPAALGIESPVRLITAKANSVTRPAKRQQGPVRAVAARVPAVLTVGHVVEASAKEEQHATPTSQMLIFVQTTETVGSNAWVWRVQVWRVTIINPVPDQTASGTVSHST